MICADANGRVSVDHYLADNRYGIPTKTLVSVVSRKFGFAITTNLFLIQLMTNLVHGHILGVNLHRISLYYQQ